MRPPPTPTEATGGGIRHPIVQVPFAVGCRPRLAPPSRAWRPRLFGPQIAPDRLSRWSELARRRRLRGKRWATNDQAASTCAAEFDRVYRIFEPLFSSSRRQPREPAVRRALPEKVGRCSPRRRRCSASSSACAGRGLADAADAHRTVARDDDASARLYEAGVDLIVATGFEAGGHRPSLGPPPGSLTAAGAGDAGSDRVKAP